MAVLIDKQGGPQVAMRGEKSNIYSQRNAPHACEQHRIPAHETQSWGLARRLGQRADSRGVAWLSSEMVTGFRLICAGF
jgi:hypothetical protein